MNLLFWKDWKARQLPDVKEEDRLTERDMKIIYKHVETDIFDENKCSVWTGCVCNKDKKHKGLYINFYHNKKKTSLHRLLYINFRNAHLDRKIYLCHKCQNAICVNVSHLHEKKKKPSMVIKKEITNADFQIDF